LTTVIMTTIRAAGFNLGETQVVDRTTGQRSHLANAIDSKTRER
jgi:hypothetical protein